MPISVRRRTRLLVWMLIIVAGAIAGWRQAVRMRSRYLSKLIDDTQRDAVAFDAEELSGLTGTPADLGSPIYLSVKSRLAKLRQIDPDARLICIVRHAHGGGKAILLADSEPPDSKKISNPGDDYLKTRQLSGLPARLPAFTGPENDSLGRRVVGYALIGETASAGGSLQPQEFLALEAGAEHWGRDLWTVGLRTALYIWFLLGLPFGGFLILYRETRQRDLIHKLSQAVEQSRSAVVITDIERRIEYVNAGFCSNTGWRREEIVGRPTGMLAEAASDPFPEIFDAARAGRTWRGETVNRRRDGSTYPTRVVASPVHNRAGCLTHVIIVLENITEGKQVEAALVYAKERAEAGDRAKGQFLSMMGHEIRTPLNGIIGFASLLLDMQLSAEQRECIRTIHDSGEALLQLTSNVLDLSRIDAGRLDLEVQRCDLLECIEAVLETVAARAAEKQLELLHAIAPGTPSAVLADAGRLRQVLGNLMDNAVKFTLTGEVEITVGAEAVSADRAIPPPPVGTAPTGAWQLTFAVRDTGIGIAPAESGKLFKPFSQVDPTSTRKYGGAGLGLAISQGLVQMMGGEISVQSEAGRGSTFSFSIAVREAPVDSETVRVLDASALQGQTLAVTSASESYRRQLVQLVKSWGARVVEYPREQLAMAEWNLAVVDVAKSEAKAWQQLLGQRPELPLRPMLALIPVDFPAEEREALRGAFRAFVTKPARHHALHALLKASLKTVQPSRAEAGPDSVAGGRLGLRVLLVEDNPVNQRLTQKILENLGCHWDLAEDGRLALSRLGRGSYDLVLLNLHVPEIDGFAVVEQIRRGKVGERNQDIWIVALTADAEEARHLRITAGGVNECLVQPFKPADLGAALRRSKGYVPPSSSF